MSNIYFIQGKKSKHIKIGLAVNPQKRLKEIQTGSWEPLSLLGTIPCDPAEAKKIEHRLHCRFHKSRTSGEWFEFTPDLISYLVEKGIFLKGATDEAFERGTEHSKKQIYKITIECLLYLFESCQKLGIPADDVMDLYKQHTDLNRFMDSFIKLVREKENVSERA